MWHPRLASTHYHIYLIPKWVHSKLVVPWAWMSGALMFPTQQSRPAGEEWSDLKRPWHKRFCAPNMRRVLVGGNSVKSSQLSKSCLVFPRSNFQRHSSVFAAHGVIRIPSLPTLGIWTVRRYSAYSPKPSSRRIQLAAHCGLYRVEDDLFNAYMTSGYTNPAKEKS